MGEMGRKETVWGARHISEDVEIKRTIDSYKELLKIDITKLEASAIVASRSQSVFWDQKKAREILSKLRGM